MRTLLKGGRVINPRTGQDEVADVLIQNQVVEAIDKNLPSTLAEEVIELSPDTWVVPGLVDIHVHFRDPGRSDKETTLTGSEAAIAGGFTTVCVMPNTDPPIHDMPTLEYVKNAAKAHSKINIHPIAAATKNLESKELTPMAGLFQNGAVAFSDDGMCVDSAKIMRLALEYTKMIGAPFICHAEDYSLAGCGCMNEGYYSTLLGLPGIPNTAESVVVARDIELARQTGGHVHFAHVSTKESVDLIRNAKKEGLHITAEVTPHHLILTDASIAGENGYDPNYKMNPPLRSEADRQMLIAAIQDGTIDAIATDHAPHTPDEKSVEFDKAPNGVVGLETAVGVILTHFLHTGLLQPIEIVRLMSTGPAEVLNLPAGVLEPGSRADITVIDPKATWTVDPTKFKSKSRNTPYTGMTLKGKPVMVFAGGECLLNELSVMTVV